LSDHIDYYFTSISPFAWLGHNTFREIAERHGKRVRYRPINLAGVWEMSGSVPLPKRSAIRQRYRLVELQRIAEFRNLPIKTVPEHFPTDPSLADHCVIALEERGEDPGPFHFAVGEALWSADRQIADRDILAELLGRTGHDAEAVLAVAGSDGTAAIRAQNTEKAIASDAIGSPCYVYLGEPFWGQDHLDLLDAMIGSGRRAFKPE
jgi:2-hydroxychromene-2-carboxylate isomerase